MTMMTDTRAVSIVDLPLIRRLTGTGTVLDSEIAFTRNAQGLHIAALSSMLFPRGNHMLVNHSESQPVVGQFRHRPDDLVAHIVYVAPELEEATTDDAWLQIFDAMARDAGRQGAHSLVAEVVTNSALFETLRAARYATYARQWIWQRGPIEVDLDDVDLSVSEETNNDQIGIMALIAHVVPTMLQQVAAPHSELEGFVYRQNGRIEAYIGVSVGRHGIYLQPYIHPDLMDQARKLILATLAQVDRANKLPISLCVRSYSSWLESSVQSLGFHRAVEQAVLVKQLTAGIRQPGFARMRVLSKQQEVRVCAPNSWSSVAHDSKDEEFA